VFKVAIRTSVFEVFFPFLEFTRLEWVFRFPAGISYNITRVNEILKALSPTRIEGVNMDWASSSTSKKGFATARFTKDQSVKGILARVLLVVLTDFVNFSVDVKSHFSPPLLSVDQ
jgi:hypothetical protein